MLMAEIEHNEHGDSGRARSWTLRAVHALHDPVWTADGYVSERWRPVSPVTGRLDAFQWQTPLAALPSDRAAVVEGELSEQAAGEAPRVEALPPSSSQAAQSSHQGSTPSATPVEPSSSGSGDGAAALASATFGPQADADKVGASGAPAVMPIIRAPDDPGVDDHPQNDGFAEENPAVARQAGGWREFLSRRET
jgi:HemY protein